MNIHSGEDCQIRHRSREGEALSRFVMLGGVIIFTGASIWLMGRNWKGVLRPNSNLTLPVASFVCTLIVVLGRCFECAFSARVDGRATKRHRWLSVALILFALAISFPQLAPLVTIAVWIPVLTEELIWWLLLFPRLKLFAAKAHSRVIGALHAARSATAFAYPTENALKTTSVQETVSPASDEIEEEELDDEEVETDESLLPSSVSQQLTRERMPNGGEYLYGLLRCRFQLGEQNQNLHVAFCPPLDSIPDVTVRQLEGEDAHPKIGSAQTFGARFELRLSSVPTEITEVILQFEAKTKIAG